jgi:hypothetical protein
VVHLTRLYRKLHRWPGLIISFLLLYYGVTGIFMNHREFFSGIDVGRKGLPQEYHYRNWNNAALKGNLVIGPDSILVYGNIGIWVTDSGFRDYRSLNHGFPEGTDNRKIFDVHRSVDGHLYAATHFGLFAWDRSTASWKKFPLEVKIKRFVAIESIGDTLYVLNRSCLFKGESEGVNTIFRLIELEAPSDHRDEILLFETIWQIHSGEIFGIPGKLFVDALGLVTVFLSATGIIYFIFPGWIRGRKRRNRNAVKIIRINRWSLKWHNLTGAWTFAFLVILFFTGIFLRPPLLIAIASSKVKPIKYSHLDQPNPWYDRLRDLIYDQEQQVFLLSTSEGMYRMSPGDLVPVRYEIQPPVSVMGINTLEPFRNGAYLVGSFSGLFLWHPSHPEIYNFATGNLFEGNPSGRPLGDFKVTGTICDLEGNLYMIDYERGILPLHHRNEFPPMPEGVLNESGMSLWNLALEIHTGRFFQFLTGDFYILIVPLTGLAGVIVVISGYLLWRKRYRRKKTVTE